jgi:hypothetical protein
MHEVDADTPLYWVRTFEAVIAEATFGEHVVAQMFGVFGIIALILAGAGLYGITAFSVASVRARSACAVRSVRRPAACCASCSHAPAGSSAWAWRSAWRSASARAALTGTLHSIDAKRRRDAAARLDDPDRRCDVRDHRSGAARVARGSDRSLAL